MRFWAKGTFRKVGPTMLTRQVGDFKMALRLTEEWHRVGTRTARPRADVVIGPYGGRTGAVSPESGDYTAEQVGASPVGHIHTAADLTGGTLGGAVVAHSEAQQDLTLMQVRNISAGTADLTAGESELAEGQIYLVYEEV